MRVDDFLSRLEKVRSTGHNRWIARCPAHDDGTPSLTVSEGDDGRILAHCFGGCAIESVVGAVGMSLSDIMPEGAAPTLPAKHRRVLPSEALEAMAVNAMAVAISAADMARGIPPTDEEKDRLFAIAGAFQEAVELTGATSIRDKMLKEVGR